MILLTSHSPLAPSPLTVVLNPQPLWFYICRKNLQAPTWIRKDGSLTAGWEAEWGECTQLALSSDSQKLLILPPPPTHTHACVHTHTHAHTQPCTSFYTSFCRRWCFFGVVQARGPCFSSTLHPHIHLGITLLCKLLGWPKCLFTFFHKMLPHILLVSPSTFHIIWLRL